MLRASTERCFRHLLRCGNSQCICSSRLKHLQAIAKRQSELPNEACSSSVRPPLWFATAEEVREIPIFTRAGSSDDTIVSEQQADRFGLVSMVSGSRGALSSLFSRSDSLPASGCASGGLAELGLEEESPDESLLRACLEHLDEDVCDTFDIADRFDAKLLRFTPVSASPREHSPLTAETFLSENFVTTHEGCRGKRAIESYRWRHLLSRSRVARSRAFSSRASARSTATVAATLLRPQTSSTARDSAVEDRVEEGFLLWRPEGTVVGEEISPRDRSVCAIPMLDEDTKSVAGQLPKVDEERPLRKKEPVNRKRFDPLEVRVQVASVEELRKMTIDKDVEGLRVILNECRWPDFDKVQNFVAELFEVFVERGVDVGEVKLLMCDFATINFRAYVRDWVVLSLLERIIREQGLLAAITYARQHRELFLMKPPMESRGSGEMRSVIDRVIGTLFSSDSDVDLAEAQSFADSLVQLHYIDEQDAFLCAAVDARLSREGFDSALKEWIQSVNLYRSTAGSHILIRAALTDTSTPTALQAKRLKMILSQSEEIGHPYDSIAELIVELLIAGRVDDAERLFLKLALCGDHFDAPLARLRGNPANIVYVERLADLITKCVFGEQKKSVKTKKKKGKVAANGVGNDVVDASSVGEPEKAETLDKQSAVDFLIARWRASKRKKKFVPPNQHLKKYKVDAKQLQQLVTSVQSAWVDVAEIESDTVSLNKLSSWCAANRIELAPRLKGKCVKIYAAKMEKCPFSDDKQPS